MYLWKYVYVSTKSEDTYNVDKCKNMLAHKKTLLAKVGVVMANDATPILRSF